MLPPSTFIHSTHAKRWQIASPESLMQTLQRRPLHDETIMPLQIERMIINKCARWLTTWHASCGLGPQPYALRMAIYYLRRIFMRKTLREMDPEITAIACLFIAGKVAELKWRVGIHGSLHSRGFVLDAMLRAANLPTVSTTDVIMYERTVLETLEFDLIVYTPTTEMKDKELELMMDSDACLLESPESMERIVRSAMMMSDTPHVVNMDNINHGALDDATRTMLQKLREATCSTTTPLHDDELGSKSNGNFFFDSDNDEGW